MQPTSTRTSTDFFSEKLRVMSFLGMIFILYIHTGFPDEVNATMAVPRYVRTVIFSLIRPCASPMFYAISGYLFFARHSNGLADIFGKMRKRVRTLLVPFIIAALFFPAVFILLESMPGASAYINGGSYFDKILSQPVWDTLCSLFYKAPGTGLPWAYHLWFLRDLIIIVALSPLVYLLRKWTGMWSILIVLALRFLFPQLSFLYGMYWFLAGSFLLEKSAKVPLWAILAMLSVFAVTAIYHQFHPDGPWQYLDIAERTLGLCAWWCLYDKIVPKTFRLSAAPALNLACQFTFFLYLYHEPALHIVVKGLPMLLGETQLGYTLTFLLSPILYAPFVIAAGYLLRRFVPGLYRWMAGGR